MLNKLRKVLQQENKKADYIIVIGFLIIAIGFMAVFVTTANIGRVDYECNGQLMSGDKTAVCIGEAEFENLKYSKSNLYLDKLDEKIMSVLGGLSNLLKYLVLSLFVLFISVKYILYQEEPKINIEMSKKITKLKKQVMRKRK